MKAKSPLVFWCLSAVAILAAVCLAWFMLGWPLTGMDDACIFFEYAKNIAEGKGIVYGNNPNPVEGCTSLLWTLVCAANFRFGFGALGVFACAIGFLLVAQLLWVSILDEFLSENEIRGVWIPRVVYIALILGTPAYVSWMTVSMMDCALWGLIIAGLTYAMLKSSRNAIAWLCGVLAFLCAPWTRPESLMVVPALLGIRLLFWKEGEFRRIFVYGCIFSLSALTLFLFRLQYFGYPYPNTYYAKVSPSLVYNLRTGIVYCAHYLTFGIPLLGTLVILLACSAFWHRLPFIWKERRSMGFGLLWLVVWYLILLAPPVLVGGDHFGYFRFFQAAYPLLLVIFIVVVFHLPVTGRLIGRLMRFPSLERFGIAGLVVFWCAATFSFAPSWRSFWIHNETAHEYDIAKRGIEQGICLSRLFAPLVPRPNVGVVMAGGFALAYDGRVVDLMGLNDVVIAHHKGDRKGLKNHAAFEPEVFLRLDVDIVLADLSGLYQDVFKGMLTTKSFVSDWRFGRISKGKDVSVEVFVRKSYIDKMLLPQGYAFADSCVWNGEAWVKVER